MPEFGGTKYTPKVFSALRNQVPQQAKKKGLWCIPNCLFSRETKGKIIHTKGPSTFLQGTSLHNIGVYHWELQDYISSFYFQGILVIISSWFTSKISGQIISRSLSDLHLLPHLPQHTQSLHQKILGEFFFRKDSMCMTSKYSRGINIVILAFRMVGLGLL